MSNARQSVAALAVIADNIRRDALRRRYSHIRRHDDALLEDVELYGDKLKRRAVRHFLRRLVEVGRRQEDPWNMAGISKKVLGYAGRQGLDNAIDSGYIRPEKLARAIRLGRCFDPAVVFPADREIKCLKVIKAIKRASAREYVDWPIDHRLKRNVFEWILWVMHSKCLLARVGHSFRDDGGVCNAALELGHEQVSETCRMAPTVWYRAAANFTAEIPADETLTDYILQWGPFVLNLIDMVATANYEHE